MSWKVVLTRPAKKALDRLETKDRNLVVRALGARENDPLSGDIRNLEGQREGFRRRVGNWRLFFDILLEHRTVVVTDIARRTTTTYRKR
jgi:mRNA-degrading endonuclease RelE of RelBE toxin-antitoxin system